jgi:hypothetical protein
MTVVAVCLVVAALLAVVVGQALLANGQVRLSALQGQLSLEQAAHRQSELSVAQLETPARIVAAASIQLHLLDATNVTELPYVPLTVPLATPQVTPAPAPPPPPATTSASSGNTGNTGSAGSGSTSSTTPTSTP